MSAGLLLLLAAGGAVAGYFTARKLSRRRLAALPETRRSAGVLRKRGFSIDAGEIVGIGQQEYLLEEGYWVGEHESALAAVFSVDGEFLVVESGLEGNVYRAARVTVELPAELPATIRLEVGDFHRRYRRPVTFHGLANAQPHSRASGVWGRYDGGGGRTLWVERRSGSVTVFLAERVHASDIFVWGRPAS